MRSLEKAQLITGRILNDTAAVKTGETPVTCSVRWPLSTSSCRSSASHELFMADFPIIILPPVTLGGHTDLYSDCLLNSCGEGGIRILIQEKNKPGRLSGLQHVLAAPSRSDRWTWFHIVKVVSCSISFTCLKGITTMSDFFLFFMGTNLESFLLHMLSNKMHRFCLLWISNIINRLLISLSDLLYTPLNDSDVCRL